MTGNRLNGLVNINKKRGHFRGLRILEKNHQEDCNIAD